ncbi:MAG: helix-turn-helix domain-containing protein [Alphaproteobacteria bacterium]|nr:helix-turn-helix domain-containing protein [Alphaproteobacteria bacterium]
MPSGQQIRAARILARWDAQELAQRVGLSRVSIQNIERGESIPKTETLEKITRVFARAGIEFIGQRGVAFRDDQIVTLHGDHIFFRLLDDVIAELKDQPHPEVLFSCVDESVMSSVVIENIRRLRGAGIAMRSLIKEGDFYLRGDLKDYRFLPAPYWHHNSILIYGDKIATLLSDTAIIVRNAPIAQAQKNMFDFVWDHAAAPTQSTASVFYNEG